MPRRAGPGGETLRDRDLLDLLVRPSRKPHRIAEARDPLAGALSALARQRPCLPARRAVSAARARLPVVGCNQPRRSLPTGPVAVRLRRGGEMEHVWTTEALAKAGTVEEVWHVGLAFCLIDMNVLHQVKAHVEKGVGWASVEPVRPQAAARHQCQDGRGRLLLPRAHRGRGQGLCRPWLCPGRSAISPSG